MFCFVLFVCFLLMFSCLSLRLLVLQGTNKGSSSSAQHPSAKGPWRTADSGTAEALPGDPTALRGDLAHRGAREPRVGTPKAVHAWGAAAPPPPPAQRPCGWAAFRAAGLPGSPVGGSAPAATLRPPCDGAPLRGATKQ